MTNMPFKGPALFAVLLAVNCVPQTIEVTEAVVDPISIRIQPPERAQHRFKVPHPGKLTYTLLNFNKSDSCSTSWFKVKNSELGDNTPVYEETMKRSFAIVPQLGGVVSTPSDKESWVTQFDCDTGRTMPSSSLMFSVNVTYCTINDSYAACPNQ